MALDTRPNNINKKACIEQSRLPQQWTLEATHIPSKQNTMPGNVTSTYALASSSIQPQQAATANCRTVTSMENSGAMQGSGLLLLLLTSLLHKSMLHTFLNEHSYLYDCR